MEECFYRRVAIIFLPILDCQYKTLQDSSVMCSGMDMDYQDFFCFLCSRNTGYLEFWSCNIQYIILVYIIIIFTICVYHLLEMSDNLTPESISRVFFTQFENFDDGRQKWECRECQNRIRLRKL